MTAVAAHQQHQSQQPPPQPQQQQYDAYIAAQYSNPNYNRNQNHNNDYNQQMPPAGAGATTTAASLSSHQSRRTSNPLAGTNTSSSSATMAPRVVSNGINGSVINGRSHPQPQRNGGPSANSHPPELTNGNSQSRSHTYSSQPPNEAEQSDADRRPSSAPGYKNRNTLSVVTSHEGSNQDRSRRPQKPPLLRSKSEHIMRQEESITSPDEEIHEWGARHGFEDHYQSDFVSQLAIVRFILRHCLFSSFPLVTCCRHHHSLYYMEDTSHIAQSVFRPANAIRKNTILYHTRLVLDC